MIGKKDHESLKFAWESLIFSWIFLCLGETFEDTNVIGVVVGLRERKNILSYGLRIVAISKKIDF